MMKWVPVIQRGCMNLLECSIPPGVAFIAEIGLGGELRKVPHMEKRVITVAKLGYKMCVVPSSAVKFLSDSVNPPQFSCENSVRFSVRSSKFKWNEEIGLPESERGDHTSV